MEYKVAVENFLDYTRLQENELRAGLNCYYIPKGSSRVEVVRLPNGTIYSRKRVYAEFLYGPLKGFIKLVAFNRLYKMMPRQSNCAPVLGIDDPSTKKKRKARELFTPRFDYLVKKKLKELI